MDADTIIVGAGLAGLVACYELTKAGKKIILLDQEGPQSIGGQAFWSLGGLFMIDTPEQRRLGIKDNIDLARQDWLGSAQFDRSEDRWPRQWAEDYLQFAAGEMRSWLHGLGMRWFPIVGWAERGGALAHGHGNSVPRFHLTWGTGPAVMAPFVNHLQEMLEKGKVQLYCRHQVDELTTQDGAVTGVRGTLLAEDHVPRGAASSREPAGHFEYHAENIIITSGGIGGNQALVRANWPEQRLGPAPKTMICGVPAHVDGRMIAITEKAGGKVINNDRMWHYTEGLRNWNPIWPDHGIRILPGPSSLWFDANGNRFPAPYLPGYDTLGTLKAILATGHDYSWFILNQRIIRKEFTLSGSEQNTDITSKSWRALLRNRTRNPAPLSVAAFMEHGEDFILRDTLPELVRAMNELSGENLLDHDHIHRQITARDNELGNKYSKDAQVIAMRNAQHYIGDRLTRMAKPHAILDPQAGPLIAVRLNILTRKTLGGLHTNWKAQVLGNDGEPVTGLYAAGEVAGFGGGGYHGYNALEGTFLGGCIFSGKIAGRAAAGKN
jgi:predicted oxidoreductase